MAAVTALLVLAWFAVLFLVVLHALELDSPLLAGVDTYLGRF